MKAQAPSVIFVRPIAQGNVGALARVMSNFGVSDLRLVQEAQGGAPFDKQSRPIDWALACRGEKILKSARIYPTLVEALHEIRWAVATSARKRESDSGYSRPFMSVTKVLEEAQNHSRGQSWALVLGPEDDGLSDEEISHCHVLTCIETSEESPSMNVAMAAGCFLHQWSLSNCSSKTKNFDTDASALASAKEIAELAKFVSEVLKQSDFYKYPDMAGACARVERIFQKQEALSRGDLLFVFEIFYRLRAKITGQFPERNFLKGIA